MKKFLCIVLGLIVMFLGFYLLFKPVASWEIFTLYFGIVLLIRGIAHIVLWFKEKNAGISGWVLADGILSTLLGGFMVFDYKVRIVVATTLIIFASVAFLIIGIMRICLAFKVKGLPTEAAKNWWLQLICGILLIIAGCISIANPAVLATVLPIFFAISIIICGADLISLSSVVK